METYRFSYTASQKDATHNFVSFFEARDVTDARLAIKAFVRVYMGILFPAGTVNIEIDLTTKNYIYGVITDGKSRITVVSGQLTEYQDSEQPTDTRESESETEIDALKKATVPTV